MLVVNNIKNNMNSLMEKLEFSYDVKETFNQVLDMVIDNKEFCERFLKLYEAYASDINTDIIFTLKDIAKELEKQGIECGTFYMMQILCFGEALKTHYIKSPLGEEGFNRIIADIKYKLEECMLVKGYIGTFVADWYINIFKMGCVAFDRLQFEIISIPESFVINGIFYSEKTKAINVHIPRTGERLDHDRVLNSYKLAAEYFAEEFDGEILFTCRSWMLYPWHKTVLSEKSNMMQFYNDYCIVNFGDYADYNQIWRLFDCEFDGDVDKLPQDSTLRRAYVERIKKGEPIGFGRGVFIYKQEW